MKKRSRAREQALQVLYLMDLSELSAQEACALFSKYFERKGNDQGFFLKLIEGIKREEQALDERIESFLQNWKLSRLGRIDKCILRMGMYELMFHSDLPVSVAIDEAVELGKRFGDEKTSAFINGVLDRAAQEFRT